MSHDEQPDPALTMRLHDPRVADIRKRLLDTSDLADEEIAQTVRVLDALYLWRSAETRLSEASRGYMKLGDSDMRALRYIIVVTDRGEIATAGGIGAHLGITSAATTKLLDRLEHGGHIRRAPHPTDRRSAQILIEPDTRAAAVATVGREHARRFHVAAGLTPAEREVVIRFLTELSQTTERSWNTSTDGTDGTGA